MKPSDLADAIERGDVILIQRVSTIKDREEGHVTTADEKMLSDALRSYAPSETAKPAAAWIPCGERKPNTYETVLFATAATHSTGYWTGSQWMMDINHESDPGLLPTHWMPLPPQPDAATREGKHSPAGPAANGELAVAAPDAGDTCDR